MNNTHKLVVLNIENGNFERGFLTKLTFFKNNDNDTPGQNDDPEIEILGNLPPTPMLLKAFESWQRAYNISRKRHLGVSFEVEEINNHINAISESAEYLKYELNAWLNQPGFIPIVNKLNEILNSYEEVRVLIQASERELWQLPWHLCIIFKNYPKLEIGLSFPGSKTIKRRNIQRDQIRILAIFGDSTNINLERDKSILEEYTSTQAEIIFLNEPKRKELYEKLWDEQGWDIIFFAGHSNTNWNLDSDGLILINKDEYITTSQLKYALKTAIGLGLKLAIFNSCDGLGLAKTLAELQIPQVIVMRKSVPDKVAQEFVKYFLERFTHGESLYTAVNQAKKKLLKEEDRYPCASWLPVICQNPTDEPIDWQALSNHQELPNKLTPETDWEVCCRTLLSLDALQRLESNILTRDKGMEIEDIYVPPSLGLIERQESSQTNLNLKYESTTKYDQQKFFERLRRINLVQNTRET